MRRSIRGALAFTIALGAYVAVVPAAEAVVVPPPEDCPDFFTGGGYLFETPTGAFGNFGVGGGVKNGRFWGHLNFIDHSDGMHVKGTSVTSYTVTGGTSRRTTGTCTIDGVEGTYTLEVADNGEPGRDDTFSLSLSTGYTASGTIDGGNIQLHKSHCGKRDLERMEEFVE